MDIEDFKFFIKDYVYKSELNKISTEKALSPELAGVSIFESPIIGVSSASDELFLKLKQDNIIGEHFKTPIDWLPTAKNVISLFFPFSKIIRDSNKLDMSFPSMGWLNGRIEGQAFVAEFTGDISNLLMSKNYNAIAPSVHPGFHHNESNSSEFITKLFTSNWSERHVAYISGLGTFGLSKGIITDAGMAGRLTSIIVDWDIPVTKRTYDDVYGNCINCGACVRNCPTNAITLENGKNHHKCAAFLAFVKEKKKPWHGCGKCQISVPCEYINPRKKV